MVFLSLLTADAAQPEGEGGGGSPDLLSIAQIQLALDNEGFSPGIIDGQQGKKTDQALEFARLAGRQVTPANSWVSWEVPQGYFDDLAPVPESWIARSKLPSMSYETAIEKLAEQFHSTEVFLRHLNPEIKDWNYLPAGTPIKVPSLTHRTLPKADHLEIRLAEKVMIAEDSDGHPLASFPCSIAAKKEKRPRGELVVRVIAPNPNYLFDPIFFPEVPEAAKIKSKLMIPPGPNNPVGVMWIGLGATASGKALKGIGLHGTPHPEEIGRTESHGCFRMTNWDVQRLAAMVKIGTRVEVVGKGD